MTTATNDLTAILTKLAQTQETIMERLAKLENGEKPVAETSDWSEPTQPSNVPSVLDELPNGVTLADVKAHAKRKGMNIQGKVTPDRVSQWLALWNADHGTQQSRPVVTQQSSDEWGSFTQQEQSAERRYGRPTAREATEMFRVHPERSFVENFPAPALRLFAQAGKPTAKVPEFRNVALNGNQRKCIMIYANGTDTDSVKLVVADAVAIAKSNGVNIVAAIRKYNG